MYKYDFVLSFAGEDRPIAEEVARHLKRHGARVFYDMDYASDLLGKDLAEHFARLYRDEARYCVVFLSAAYIDKLWCRWERCSAIARAFESTSEYLLPYRLEPVDLPSIPGTIGRADYASTPPVEFAALLLRKLFHAQSAIEFHPGIYLALPEQADLVTEGQPLFFGADDHGYGVALYLPAVIRNTTDAAIRVVAGVSWPQGGEHPLELDVAAASEASVRLPLAEATREGDGDVNVSGPAELDATLLTRMGESTSLEEGLARAFRQIPLTEYQVRFVLPGEFTCALVVANDSYRLRWQGA